nr:hypothetical protein BaRGS_012823 [Batillaria attramentaria]
MSFVLVDNLVSLLTLEELQLQMARGGHGPDVSPAPPIPRLGVGPYSWNTECLSGDAQAGPATSFPMALGMAATFRNKEYGDHKGLSCFSPVINIMRDPRWGRNQVSDLDWQMTFLPAFRECVKAGTYNIMCSYNSINGVPACANKKLLTDILRDRLGFKGYVISDEGALPFMVTQHHYVTDYVKAAAAAIDAGVSLEIAPGNDDKSVFMHIKEAVEADLIPEDTVRERTKPLFYTRMRLGEFDPPDMNPYSKLDLSLIQSPAHQSLSLEAAVKSVVLLKNKDGFLPLNDVSDYKDVVVCSKVEAEGRDRPDVELPGKQLQLLKDVLEFKLPDAPVVLVLFNAGPLNVTWADQHPGVTAILECFFPAQTTGTALLHVLTNYGGTSSPAGRLPNTWPQFASQTVCRLGGKLGPLYPFGYGLSYTTFSYSDLKTPHSLSPNHDLTLSVTVTNTGNYTADEVTQVYVSWPNTTFPTPLLQLVAVTRTTLTPGQPETLTFTVPAQYFAVYTYLGWLFPPDHKYYYYY